MIFRIGLTVFVLCAAALLPACGDNVASDTTLFSLAPPTALQAFSAGSQKVSLHWTPPGGSSNAKFAGYKIQWGTKTDTLPPTQQTIVIDSLPTGATIFSVFSRTTTGEVSDPAVLSWAPAARFDSLFVLHEYNAMNPNQNEGIHLGSRLTNPSLLLLGDAQAQAIMDFYLWGEGGQQLRLRSANLYIGTWNLTSFSTQVDAGPSLDTYLSGFPSITTFTQADVAVVDNMICYARFSGDGGEINYVRIFIRVIPGESFPDRSVQLSISLQRVPSLLFAADLREMRRPS